MMITPSNDSARQTPINSLVNPSDRLLQNPWVSQYTSMMVDIFSHFLNFHIGVYYSWRHIVAGGST